MKASVFTQAKTELGDKCEVRFDIADGRLAISVLGVQAQPEYVVLRSDNIAKVRELLIRLARSSNGTKPEDSRPVDDEAGTLPGSELSRMSTTE